MSPPVNKLELLAYVVGFTLVSGWFLWRNREALATARQGGSAVWVALAGAAILLFGMGWWNGMAVYMADESDYQFEARMLEAGKWKEKAPPRDFGDGAGERKEYLPLYVMRTGEEMFPIYPVGWPAVLAGLGRAAPWWVINPLLGTVLLALVYWYGRQFLPEGSGEGAVWVLALSGMYLLNCVGYTAHPLTGVLLLLGAIWTERSLESGRGRDMVLAGLFCGMAVVARPLNGAIGLAVVGLLLFWRSGYRAALLAGGSGGLFAGAALGWQNWQTMGEWHRSGYAAYVLQHTPSPVTKGAVELLGLRLADSMACSAPGLAVLAMVACAHPETRRRSLVYLGLAGVTVVAYGVAMPLDSDSPIGERYYFECLPYVAMVAGMGWARVSGWAGRHRWLLPVAGILLAVYPMVTLTRAHHGLRRTHGLLLEWGKAHGGEADLVLLEESAMLPAHNYWLNPTPWEEARTVYFRAPEDGADEAMARALGRRRWKRLRYDEATGKLLVAAESR